MPIAKCINCGISDKKKPVVWVLVEYQLEIGLCYDCDNGSNKLKFWSRKNELISEGKANTNKPGVTSLSAEQIKEKNGVPQYRRVALDKVDKRNPVVDKKIKVNVDLSPASR